ncbi:MAG TPA: DNA ligase D [Longimicrobiales bacterium]
MGLETYHRKRDFGRTPEPAGSDADRSTGDALAFVVQKHAASHLHYDFRLELDGVLKSWAVPKGPVPDPAIKRLAMQVEDHPLDYGDFEGTIPKGQYGGGTVMLWDRGTWTPIGDARAGLKKGRLEFELEGEKLHGRWMLVRSGPPAGKNGKASWLLFKRSDEHARPGSGDALLEEESLSVSTGRSMKEITAGNGRVWSSKAKGGGKKARAKKAVADTSAITGAKSAKRMPATVEPQLATLVSDAPAGDDWLHEIKFDGYRFLARAEKGDVALITRGGQDWSDRFGRIAAAVGSLGVDAIIDGEAVVLDEEGRSSFQKLQNAMDDRGRSDVYFYAFDLLWLDGVDLRGAALVDRKEALRVLLANAPSVIRYSDHVRGGGPEFHANACELQLEGIISKRASSRYAETRSKDWLKVKCLRRQEFVIGGWSEPTGSRESLGSLVLAVHDDDGALRYAGRVGTGFDNRTLRMLYQRLRPLERKTPALKGAPRSAGGGRAIHWVDPELVAEVAFTEWTGDGVVRHPSFQGLREDKPAREVVRETESATAPSPSVSPRAARAGAKRLSATKSRSAPTEFRGVSITSPDKVLWSEQGVTKLELFEYWDAVAEHALEWMAKRPLTLVRCPQGAGKKCFFQKHANRQVPDVVPRAPIREGDGKKTTDYLMVDSPASIIALVQLGVMEFHVWGSRIDRLDRPDLLVMDVDPAPDVEWPQVVEAALVLRNLLGELGLETWPRGTGGKGLHVVAPLARRNDWDDVKTFTRRIAELMSAAAPDRFLAKASKSARKGRIYVDYLRNAYNATAVATLSPRAREGAPVALPLAWDDVIGSTEPFRLTVRDVPAVLEHLKREPWDGFLETRQSITKAALTSVGR